MARIIAFANRKGGSGKTTTTVNVASALAHFGNRVCIIDTDSQAHASLSLGIKKQDRAGLYAILTEDKSPKEVMINTYLENLKLIPASRMLIEYERKYSSDKTHRTLLSEKINNIVGDFDFIIFDTSPALSLLTLSALIASREVYIPMQAHFLAMEGLAEMVRLIYTINKLYNPRLRLKGIIPTFFSERTRLSRAIIEEIKKNLGETIILRPIRANISLAEAPSYGKTIFQYNKKSNGAIDYYYLAKEIERLK